MRELGIRKPNTHLTKDSVGSNIYGSIKIEGKDFLTSIKRSYANATARWKRVIERRAVVRASTPITTEISLPF